MGALVSLPLIPVQMAASALASCAGASISSAICGACGSMSPLPAFGARLVYAVLFIANSFLAWLSLSDWAIAKLDLLRYACGGDECTGFVAVHRICSSLGGLHLVLAAGLAYAVSQRHFAAARSWQNGWWRIKFVAWALVLVGNFLLIPASVWVRWGNYGAPLLSFIFVFIGLVLLVDAAHSWAEMCFEKMDEEELDTGGSNWWRGVLVGSTLGMYLGAIILTGIMVGFFADSGCSINQAAITLNVIAGIIVSVLSVHEKVQEYNPRAGLAQSAMVVLYCTYQTMSAVASEPDDRHCNPFVRSRGTRTLSIVLGALFTFLAIAYTTSRAASRPTASVRLPEDTAMAELRRQALRQAVQEGSLPASALDDDGWANDEDEDEEGGANYNFWLFHLVFLLATQYTATLLTMNVEKDLSDGFVPVGRTYFASWVKIVSSWICYGLYAWSLVAPIVLPDRFELA